MGGMDGWVKLAPQLCAFTSTNIGKLEGETENVKHTLWRLARVSARQHPKRVIQKLSHQTGTKAACLGHVDRGTVACFIFAMFSSSHML